MKKIAIIVLAILTILTTSMISTTQAVTIGSAPYPTYTIGPDNRRVLTQTAYEPAGYINNTVSLSQPQDMYLKDDIIYVADTGNRRIVKFYPDGTDEVIISEGLETPTGVHVDEDDYIYVVDRGARTIIKYDAFGEVVFSFGRPTEPIFGVNSRFEPLKITTGPRGIMYVTGEGSTSGVMQFNHAGEFLGFLGTNPTNIGFYRRILEFFNIPLASVTPISPANLAVDAKGSLYTVSPTSDSQMRKFNISSTVVLSLTTEETPVAVYVSDFGNIYTVSPNGTITEYDSYGQLIFQFGGQGSSTQVLGSFDHAVDIAVDSNYNIYVLDRDTGRIQVLQRSEFTALVHQGLMSLNQGIYDIDEWQNVLRMNSVFAMANSVIARSQYRLGNYDEAVEYFRIASDRSGYSDAFWQIRYEWMQQYLGIILMIGIILFVTLQGLKFADRKWEIYDPLRKFSTRVDQVKVLRELRLLKQMIRHPLNTYDDLKFEGKSSYVTATIIYAIFLVLNIVAVYTTGFLFNFENLTRFNMLIALLSTGGIIILFVFSNYLISTLSSGEGWFKDVYIGTAYALAPYIFLTIPIILLSHVLTENESFVYYAIIFIRDAWMYTLIVFMIKDIHHYNFRQLFKNILLTIFTMAMIVVILLLIYLLTNQMWDYIDSVIREVISRGSN